MQKLTQKQEKWIAWSNIILIDTQKLLIKTKLFEDYARIVESNLEIQNPSDFHDWTRRNYYESALMGIRRLLDTNRDCISLVNLMEELKCYYAELTKDFYLRDYPINYGNLPTTRDYASDRFDAEFSENGEFLSQSIVEKDINDLKTKTKLVESFIDNTLAHHNKGQRGEQSISTTNVQEAIKEIEDLAIKYLELVGKGGFVGLTPTWQYDHTSIFTKAWVKPESIDLL